MWRAVLVALVMAFAAQAQTIYTWTDARGTVHYTDDPSSIPAGVKAATTEGEELSNTGPSVKAPARPEAPPQEQQQTSKPTSDEEYWRGLFRAAREKVKSLEDEVSIDQRSTGGQGFYCPPMYGYYPPGYGYGFPPGYSYRQSNRAGLGASLNVPLGNGASLNVNGSAGSVVQQNNTTVVPFQGTVGYGYVGCYEDTRARDRIEKTKLALKRAQEELGDLERRAANASVALEWRR
jgi:hypothetical protein